MWLFALFLAIPLIEIALFIQVGGWIGLFPTLAIVVITAILGTWLVRHQGLMAIAGLQKSFRELADPTEPLAHGAMILIAGALLLTPGFFTDAVGFLFLIPGVRMAVMRYVRARVNVATMTYGDGPGPQNTASDDPNVTIDGEFEDVTSDAPPRKPTHNPPSGWTRH